MAMEAALHAGSQEEAEAILRNSMAGKLPVPAVQVPVATPAPAPVSAPVPAPVPVQLPK